MKHEMKLQLKDIHTRKNTKIATILKKRFASSQLSTQNEPFWDASSYGLDKVEYFLELAENKKVQLLNELAQNRVSEAFHIEKSGIAYGSKMTILSDNIDERVLYGSFTGDEARHFKLIEKYHHNTIAEDITDNSFLEFLSNTIEVAPKKSLVFMIQVLLEGWGLDHYSTMAKECKNSNLKTDLQSILEDEVVHHGSGVILFDENNLTKEEREFIIQSLISFFQMVQVGPIGILAQLETMTSKFNNYNRVHALEQLNAFGSTDEKLLKLKRLMRKAGANSIIEELEGKGLLRPLDLSQMAACF